MIFFFIFNLDYAKLFSKKIFLKTTNILKSTIIAVNKLQLKKYKITKINKIKKNSKNGKKCKITKAAKICKVTKKQKADFFSNVI